jgi:hypothetical protein
MRDFLVVVFISAKESQQCFESQRTFEHCELKHNFEMFVCESMLLKHINRAKTIVRKINRAAATASWNTTSASRHLLLQSIGDDAHVELKDASRLRDRRAEQPAPDSRRTCSGKLLVEGMPHRNHAT